MPDFNKGDFTQQGVNGHVNATVRLNEKRLVNIDMTSNEEAEGCTITGTVTDLLNDKVYNIGSGGGTLVSLTATENGEYDPADYEADGFSDVTVNVAGGMELLKTSITYDATALAGDADYSPVLTAIGYGIIPQELNDNDPNLIFATFDNNEGQYIMTVGPGETLELTVLAGEITTFNFYYMMFNDDPPTGAIALSDSNVTATNMSYDSDNSIWLVDDVTENSSLYVTLSK